MLQLQNAVDGTGVKIIADAATKIIEKSDDPVYALFAIIFACLAWLFWQVLKKKDQQTDQVIAEFRESNRVVTDAMLTIRSLMAETRSEMKEIRVCVGLKKKNDDSGI